MMNKTEQLDEAMVDYGSVGWNANTGKNQPEQPDAAAPEGTPEETTTGEEPEAQAQEQAAQSEETIKTEDFPKTKAIVEQLNKGENGDLTEDKAYEVFQKEFVFKRLNEEVSKALNGKELSGEVKTKMDELGGLIENISLDFNSFVDKVSEFIKTSNMFTTSEETAEGQPETETPTAANDEGEEITYENEADEWASKAAEEYMTTGHLRSINDNSALRRPNHSGLSYRNNGRLMR